MEQKTLESLFQTHNLRKIPLKEDVIYSNDLVSDIKKIKSMEDFELTHYINNNANINETLILNSIYNRHIDSLEEMRSLKDYALNSKDNIIAFTIESYLQSIEAPQFITEYDFKKEYDSIDEKTGEKKSKHGFIITFKRLLDGFITTILNIVNWVIRMIMAVVRWIQTTFYKLLSNNIKIDLDILAKKQGLDTNDKIKSNFNPNSYQLFKSNINKFIKEFINVEEESINNLQTFLSEMNKGDLNKTRKAFQSSVNDAKEITSNLYLKFFEKTEKMKAEYVTKSGLKYSDIIQKINESTLNDTAVGELELRTLVDQIDKAPSSMAYIYSQIFGNAIIIKDNKKNEYNTYEWLFSGDNYLILTETAKKDLDEIVKMFEKGNKLASNMRKYINSFAKENYYNSLKDYTIEDEIVNKINIFNLSQRAYLFFSHFFTLTKKEIVLNFWKLRTEAYSYYKRIVKNPDTKMDDVYDKQEPIKVLN